MNEILVFDPAQCCSTGVCGSEVDPVLVRFAADLEWLAAQGVPARRFNLAQEATAFAQNALVRRTLQQEGTECLPLVLRAGEIVSRGRYPSRAELATWGGMAATVSAALEGKELGERPASVESAGSGCCSPAVVILGGSPPAGRRPSGC